MRISTAYFAGAGTIVAAIAIGVGGGFTIANITNPHDQGQEISRIDRRGSSEPAKAASAPSEPVSYLAATQDASTKPVTVSSAPQPQQPQVSQSNSPATAQPETIGAYDAAAQPPMPPAQTAAREPAVSSEGSVANPKARDADLRRAAAEKRRADRRQQWAERRHLRQDDDLRDVEQKVREETEAPRTLAVDPMRAPAPRSRLFDAGDD